MNKRKVFIVLAAAVFAVVFGVMISMIGCSGQVVEEAGVGGGDGGAATTSTTSTTSTTTTTLPTVATPTFTPAAGNHDANNLTVTVACATDGASFFYSTDGSTPSVAYPAGGIGLNASRTIKVMATKDGYRDSDIGSATYNLYWWQALGSGVDGEVKAFAYDGTGAIYVGGSFNNAGGAAAAKIAKWNIATSAWSPLGLGMDVWVSSLAYDGAGNLYAGGNFGTAGGGAAAGVAKWSVEDSAWSALGGFLNPVWALSYDGAGSLYVGGFFDLNLGEGVIADNVVKRNGGVWSVLGSGMGINHLDDVFALAYDGAGNLYAGGGFTTAGEVAASKIAKWNVAGSTWSSLDDGLDDSVLGLAVDGAGNLYVGGNFTATAGDDPLTLNYIAKWNADGWSALGSGLGSTAYALALDGSGTLYAGGSFSRAGGNNNCSRIAKWNGVTWLPLGTGIDNGDVQAVVVVGPDIYVGGTFTNAGGIEAADYIAKWGKKN